MNQHDAQARQEGRLRASLAKRIQADEEQLFDWLLHKQYGFVVAWFCRALQVSYALEWTDFDRALMAERHIKLD